MAIVAPNLRVVVILDAEAARGRDPATLAAAAARGGATMLQVRAKGVSAAAFAELVRAAIRGAPHLPVIVNDRLDVALATGAAGCHLGQDDLPLAAARTIAPAGFLLGGSAGSRAEAVSAATAGADYLGVGPVNTSGNKGDAGPAIGVSGFRALRDAVPRLPVVAIGGVRESDVPGLIAAGAAGVAVIGAVLGSADPESATTRLRLAVDKALGLDAAAAP